MNRLTKWSWLFLVLVVIPFSGCTSGGDQESKFATVFSDIDKSWSLYEINKKGATTIIKVDVQEVVSFKKAKLALKRIQEIDPKIEGYIEFYNSEVGMVLRKVEIIPLST